MAKEYKTLVFPDTMQGRKEMAAEITASLLRAGK